MKRAVFTTLIAMAIGLVALPASAGLVGTTVTQCADSAYIGVVTANPASCNLATAQATPGSAVVGAGVEFSLVNSGSRTFDFSDDLLTIIFSNVGSPSPDLFVFDFETDITSASVIGGNVLNLTFTFADDKLGILVSSPQQNGTVVLDLGSNNNVPEPDSFALAMLAMLGVAATRRRRH